VTPGSREVDARELDAGPGFARRGESLVEQRGCQVLEARVRRGGQPGAKRRQ
jgi:hypothetical protein